MLRLFLSCVVVLANYIMGEGGYGEETGSGTGNVVWVAGGSVISDYVSRR